MEVKPKLASKILSLPVSDAPNDTLRCLQNSMLFLMTSYVASCVIILLKDSALASVEISLKILKYNHGPILDILTNLFNKSFSQRIFPSEIKTAKVLPLSKPGNCLLFDNYRPIPILFVLYLNQLDKAKKKMEADEM